MHFITRFFVVVCYLTLWTVSNSQATDFQRDRYRSQYRSSGESRLETFPATEGGRLEVASSSGDIRIVIWEKTEVSVAVDGIEKEDLADLDMTQRGDVIRVDYRPRGRRWTSNIHFEISIPTRYKLNLQTGGGDIEVIGNLSGDIRCDTSGGDITVEDVTGLVDINTSGGDIRTGIIHGEGYIKTSGGDIRVEESTGELDVQTSGGDITIGNVGNKLGAHTSGGDIIIGDVGGEARLSTSGGDIEVGEVSGGARLNTSGGDIELRSASGDVRANTAGGDMELEDITGTIEARTAGGNILAELIPSGNGRSSLITAGGHVTLYIAGDAKATIEARIRVDGRWRNRRGNDRDKSRSEYEIRSDFKANTYDEEEFEIRGVYILNGGGERIWLETAHGNIYIRELTRRRSRD